LQKTYITMKKILFFAVLAVALAGYGVHAGIANAQTVTSSGTNSATLEQQLQVAKATLVNLEMQQGMIPQGDDQLGGNATPSVTQAQPQQTQTTSGLSRNEISAFENTLATLVETLSQLNASLIANPNMTASQTTAVATTLGGMKSTLVAMAATISADEAASPIAMAAPVTSVPTTGMTATTPVPAQAAPSAPAITATTVASPTTATAPATAAATVNPVQATAQASSIWSSAKAHWPAIVIILLVIVILAILFWPESDEKEAATPVTTQTTTTPKTTATTATSSVSAAVASAPAKTSAQPVVTAPTDTTKIA
jgi:hypothetical protein